MRNIYLFQKLFREAIGTRSNWLLDGSTVQWPDRGFGKDIGLAASTNSIQEIRKADCILVIGVDPAATHPIIKNEIHLAIRRNRAQLIVLGSHDIGLTRATQISPMFHPSMTLLDKPGMEVSLLNAMIGTILKEGLEDKGFIAEKTQGIEELRKKKAGSPNSENEWLGTLTEAKKTEIEKAARAFAQAKKAMILIGSGHGSPFPRKRSSWPHRTSALITGHLGKESSGLLLLLDKCNSQGAIDIGTLCKERRMGIERSHPEGRGRQVKGRLYGRGKSSRHLSRCRSAEEAFENLPCLIVQDLFMTETAKMAHVVLPASSFVEKGAERIRIWRRRVQKLNPLRPPRDQSKPDFEIFFNCYRFSNLLSPEIRLRPSLTKSAVRFPITKVFRMESSGPRMPLTSIQTVFRLERQN